MRLCPYDRFDPTADKKATAMLARLDLYAHLVLAALIAAGSLVVIFQPQPADAQQRNVRKQPVIVAPGALVRPRAGGYSMTLSEIWGLPEMPPAPKDFGPHFDYPPGGYDLNGPPDRAPYPN
jgi:hypothetical protein